MNKKVEMFNFETSKNPLSKAEISAQLIASFLESHENQLKTSGLEILKQDLETAITQEVQKMESVSGLEEAKKLAQFILDDLDYYKEFLSARDDNKIKSRAREFLVNYLVDIGLE